MDAVNQAQASFQAQPATIRDRFRNNPAEFIKFVQDPQNQEELIKLGLASRKQPVESDVPQKTKKKSETPAKPESPKED